MSSSCQALAQRYVQETGQALPSATAPTDLRSNWLLTQTWGCVPPGGTYPDDFHADLTYCQQFNNPPKAAPGQPNTALTRPPLFNYLEETGFLHWVNQRGLQCVNRIVGNFYGFNAATGNANLPSVSVSPPDSQCWGACFQVTSASDMCFECINQTLLAQPSLCPQLNPANPEDETLIRDAVNCHECIGSQSTFVPKNGSATTPDETAMVDQVWRCITGTVPPPLTAAEIAVIALVGVFVLVMVVVLAVYYGYLHPKVMRQEQERRRLMAAGYSPDDL